MAALAAVRGTGGTEELPRLPDAALALGLAVAAQLDLRFDLDNSTHYGSDFATAVVVAVATLALAWRRRHPFVTLCVVAAAVAGPELFVRQTFTLWGHFAPLLVAAWTVARWCSGRLAAVAAAIVAVTVAVVMVRVPAAGGVGNIPFAVVPAAGLMVAGRVLQRRHERARALSDRTQRLEAEHEADVAAALVAERSRIARELHDVVAHCVSVMVVQAGVSEALLEASPERAREPLLAVQETGQQAISELTRMLGLLRGAGAGASQLAPQPGVAQLDDLVERLVASGLDVRLRSVGDVRPLPPGLDLTVFRIVQEALTNTLKHAGRDATAQVELRYLPEALELEVADDGPGSPTPAGTGHGLIGMAERVSVFGGSIRTGRRPGGGFGVLVVLPVAGS